jgi:hypothetical protein
MVIFFPSASVSATKVAVVGNGAATADVVVVEDDVVDDDDSFDEPLEQADREPRATMALNPTSRVRSCFFMPTAWPPRRGDT